MYRPTVFIFSNDLLSVVDTISAIIQGVPKKERHFKYICKVANNSYIFF